MDADPDAGLTIRRLYNRIEEDARKMLVARPHRPEQITDAETVVAASHINDGTLSEVNE
jgi:hypothetical protein